MATIASLMDPTLNPTCQFPLDPCSVPPPPMPDWLNVSWVEQQLVDCCSWQVYRRECLGITEGPIVSTTTPTIGATTLNSEKVSSTSQPSAATGKPNSTDNQGNSSSLNFTASTTSDSTAGSSNVTLISTTSFVTQETPRPSGVVASASTTIAWLLPVIVLLLVGIALITWLAWRYHKKSRKEVLDVSVYKNCNYLHNKAKNKEKWAGCTVIQNKFVPTDILIKDSLYDSVKTLSPILTNGKAPAQITTNSPKNTPKSPKLNTTKVTPAVYSNEYVLPNQPANNELVNVGHQSHLPPINTSPRQVFPSVPSTEGVVIDAYSEVNDVTDSPGEKPPKPKRRRKKKKPKKVESKNNDLAPDDSRNDLSDMLNNDLNKQTSYVGGTAGDTSC